MVMNKALKKSTRKALSQDIVFGSATDLDCFYTGDAAQILKSFGEGFVDLIVTSPPYEDMRNYNGYEFNAAVMFRALYRVLKIGGVCVWVVGERIKGGRSLKSFEHAFLGRDCGFNVHDVMIYQKKIHLLCGAMPIQIAMN